MRVDRGMPFMQQETRIEPIVFARKRASKARKGIGVLSKPKKKSKRPLRAKEVSISVLVKRLDTVFSQWVRLSHVDKDGMVECYTCKKYFHYKKLHAGHYISRFYKQTRWDERNVKPQCPMDNLWKRGDPVSFRERLVQDYGNSVVEEMEGSRSISQKLDRAILLVQIELYTRLLLRLR